MNRRGLLRWLIVLAVLHACVACAGFLAPYDPVQQDRDHPYLPPMRARFVDQTGHLHLRPFFYGLRLKDGSFEQFEEEPLEIFPLYFFVSGARYRLFGLFPSSLHLFGARSA